MDCNECSLKTLCRALGMIDDEDDDPTEEIIAFMKGLQKELQD